MGLLDGWCPRPSYAGGQPEETGTALSTRLPTTMLVLDPYLHMEIQDLPHGTAQGHPIMGHQ